MLEDIKGLPKRCCARCHFLTLQLGRRDVRNDTPLSDIQRRSFLAGELVEDMARLPGYFGCMRNVWNADEFRPSPSSGAGRPDLARLQEAFRRDRGDSCFFFPYAAGMPIPVAEELERREADRREAEGDRELTRNEGKQDRRHTRIMLGLVAGMLLLSAYGTLRGCWCGDHGDGDAGHHAETETSGEAD